MLGTVGQLGLDWPVAYGAGPAIPVMNRQAAALLLEEGCVFVTASPELTGKGTGGADGGKRADHGPGIRADAADAAAPLPGADGAGAEKRPPGLPDVRPGMPDALQETCWRTGWATGSRSCGSGCRRDAWCG